MVEIALCLTHRNYQGQTIANLAAQREQDPRDWTLDLISEGEAFVSAVHFALSPADVERVLRDERVMIGSDAVALDLPFSRLNVSASGVTQQDSVSNLISGFSAEIVYQGGRVYSTTGRVIDPEARTLLGTYAASGLVLPDSRINRVFFLSTNGLLSAFDMSTFVPVGSFTIPNFSGTPTSLVRLSGDGLAFRTSNSQVFLVNTALAAVPEPSTVFGFVIAGVLSGSSLLLRRPHRRA